MCTSPDFELAEQLTRAIATSLKSRRCTDSELTRLFTEMHEKKRYHVYGDASIFEYAKRVHQLEAGRVHEYLRIGRKLAACPAISAAFAAGEIDRTKVREVLVKATAETERAWLGAIEGKSNREVERLVRATPKGEPPPEIVPPDSSPMGHIRLEGPNTDVDEVRAAIRDRRRELGEAGDGLTDVEVLALICRSDRNHRAAPEGSNVPRDGARYQIILRQCPTCDNVTGENDRPVTDAIASEARCDCVEIDLRPGPNHGRSRRSVPPKARRATLARHDYKCAVPECPHRVWVDVHHIRGRRIRRPHRAENMVPLCEGHHRLVHKGTLTIERLPDGTLVFQRPNVALSESTSSQQ